MVVESLGISKIFDENKRTLIRQRLEKSEFMATRLCLCGLLKLKERRARCIGKLWLGLNTNDSSEA